MDCPNCGVSVREGARFCGACGTALPAAEAVGPQKGPSLPPLSASPPPITVPLDVAPPPAASAPPPPPPGAPAPPPASSNAPWVVAAVAAVVVAVAVVAMVVAFAGNDDSADGSAAPTSVPSGDAATEAEPATTTSSTSTTSSTTSTTLDPEAAALAELRDRVEQDEDTFAARGLEDTFVPQLSAKQLGTSDDGIIYSYEDIVAHIEDLENAFGEVLVLSSSDYSSFEAPGFFVMMVPESFGSGEGALGWCFDHGLTDKNDCFAKFVSRTEPSSDFTTMLPDEL